MLRPNKKTGAKNFLNKTLGGWSALSGGEGDPRTRSGISLAQSPPPHIVYLKLY